MGKFILVLPENSFHANQTSESMEWMDRERGGFEVFRRHKIPATVFCQGVDLLMRPWLKEEMAIPGPIEFGCAPFSHTLMPLFDEGWRAEIEHGCYGSVPVMFFGEFCIPKGSQIPKRTPYTLVLTSNSVMYSSFTASLPSQRNAVVANFPPDVPAVQFEGTTGILMREEWYRGFLQAFFAFQRFPNKEHLSLLLDEVAKIAKMPDDYIVVCPLDLEAPYVGSFYGQLAWEIFFEGLEESGLKEVFQPLSAYLDYFAEKTVPGQRPHRKLDKWMSWEKQLKQAIKLGRIQPRNKREELVKMIATGSDWFAAWGIQLEERRSGKKVQLSAQKPDGTTENIPISYNPAVIAVQQAAYEGLKNGSSFASQLDKLEFREFAYNNDHFIKAAIVMAILSEL